jgi:hypothetical protein
MDIEFSNMKKRGGLVAFMDFVYWIGFLISAGVLLNYKTSPNWARVSLYENMICAVVFILWGGLIYSGAYLAEQKGRQAIEGAVLGALGPLGFIVEVLLPPVKTEDSTKPPNLS